MRVTSSTQPFADTQKTISISDRSFLNRSLACIPNREAQRVLGDRLVALAAERNPNQPTVTQHDFYQAIEDFSDTADYHAAHLNDKTANIARGAFEIATTAYMKLTGDRDVFSKTYGKTGQILDQNLKAVMPGKSRPDPHLAQKAIKTGVPIDKLGR